MSLIYQSLKNLDSERSQYLADNNITSRYGYEIPEAIFACKKSYGFKYYFGLFFLIPLVLVTALFFSGDSQNKAVIDSKIVATDLKPNEPLDKMVKPDRAVEITFAPVIADYEKDLSFLEDNNRQTLESSTDKNEPSKTVRVKVRNISKSSHDYTISGYADLVRGNFENALDNYDNALLEDSENLQAMLGKASALYKLNKKNQAQELYEEVLSYDAENVEALNNILAIASEYEPEKTLTKLLELERKVGWFSPLIEQIGFSYSRMNNYARAEFYLEKALSMSPENILYMYNLAIVYDRGGKTNLACMTYQKILRGLEEGQTNIGVSKDEVEKRLVFLSRSLNANAIP